MMKSALATTMAAMLVACAEANKAAASAVNAEYDGIFSANKNIGNWINPNAFVGIFFMIMFFWFCMWTLQMLSAIQTPTVMLEKCIDWGKVEKIEE